MAAPNYGSQTFRNFYDNIPYGGQGGMEWITKKGIFTMPMLIKMLPVRDMSRPPARQPQSDFDSLIYNIRTNLPRGSKVKAIKVVENKAVDGFVSDIKIDYEKQRIRIFVRDNETNQVDEVYPESVYRDISVRESQSYVLTLSEFVEKTNDR